MNNTKNILLVTLITATLVMGASVIPMQSYADRGDSDDRKKDNDYKSKTSASYESDKKISSQHLDQENFCYRGDNDCQQANQGQQIVGKDNEAKGFNDQSDNLALSALGAGAGNGTTPTPKTCLECFAPILLSFKPGFLSDFLGKYDITSGIAADICNITTFSEEELRVNLNDLQVKDPEINALIKCLRDAGVTITA